jgi:hypothetical protein
MQFGLTCPIYFRFRGVFPKANNSGLRPPPVTASERTQKITNPLIYKGRCIAKKQTYLEQKQTYLERTHKHTFAFICRLYYRPYLFTPTLYAFSQPLYRVFADFAQHIGIDSSTTVCNSLPKVTKILNFNSIQLFLQESPKCKVQRVKVRWSWCQLHWASPPNPSMRKHVIEPIIKIPIGSRLFGHSVDLYLEDAQFKSSLAERKVWGRVCGLHQLLRVNDAIKLFKG